MVVGVHNYFIIYAIIMQTRHKSEKLNIFMYLPPLIEREIRERNFML